MNLRLRRYKKDFEHSYTFGVFPTLELLHHKPQDVLGVVIHPKGSSNEGVTKIQAICQQNQIPLQFDAKVHNRIGARENDYAVGVFRVAEAGLAPDGNHVILVNPSGMGNLGTIIRTMLGFDFLDLAIIQPAADIFHPDVVRASMGALFQIRFERFSIFKDYQQAYPRKFFSLMTDGAIPLQDAVFEPPFGLVFGNESSGLPEEFHLIGTSISIPQSQRIDSLNLAMSVSITLYQASVKIER